MRKLVAPALLALVALAGDAYAQSSGTGGGASGAAGTAGGGRSGQSSSAAGASDNNSGTGAAGNSQSATGARGASDAQSAGASAQDPLEQHIAVALYLGNQEEIALSQFGLQRAESDQVKQFAQMMVEQHQQAISQMQQAAPHLTSLNLELTGGQGDASGAASRGGRSGGASGGASGAGTSTGGATSGADDATSSSTSGATGSTTGGTDATSTLSGATSAGNQRGGGAAAQGGQTQEMAQYMREVKERCLALSTQELGRKQGAEFDKAFMGMQVVLHTGMLAHLQAAQGRASSQMQPLIQQGTEMTQHHLAQARTIMEQLGGGEQGRTGAPRAASGATGGTSRQ